MALPTVQVPGFDPNLITGPTRALAGPVNFDVITTNTPYGATGVPQYATWLYVGTTGNVSVVRWDGTTVVIPTMAAGVWHRICTKMVNTTGTTASNLLWGN